jgi:capsular exopolysaccharide synthesis family protein
MYQLASGQAPRSFQVEAPPEFEWSRLWQAFLRRRRIFTYVAAGSFLLIAAYTLFMPRSYTTHVKLIAGNAGPSAGSSQTTNTTVPLLNALLAATGVQSSETYAELFQENPVANAVIEQLKLPMTASQLLGHVKVIGIVNTNVLDLAVTWSNPQMSATVANAFAGAFVDHERSLVGTQADDAIKTLTTQLPAAQNRAATAEAALTQFQSKNDMADLQTQTQNVMNAAAALDAKVNATEVDRGQAAAQLSSISSQLNHIGPTVNGQTTVQPNPVLSQLQQQLAQATVQLQVAEQQYTDQHPTVIGLKRQQAELQREIAQTAATVIAQSNTMPNPVFVQLNQQAASSRAQVASDSAQLGQLNRQRAQMQPQLAALPGKATTLLALQRDAKLADDVVTALQQKLNDANISKATALSDVTVTAPASANEASQRPDLMLNLVIGAFSSLVLGVVVTLLVFVFDRRIRDESQIEDELDLPVLASVPQLGALQRLPGSGILPSAHLANDEADEPWLRSFVIESFLQLVTSLRYSATADKRMRCITVTSPSQGDGKSTIALNTAITMAHIEPRVLLIDADLRRPSLHSKLNRELGFGLSDVLVGTSELREVVMTTEHEGLDLLTSGTRTPNSVKLIQSRRFDELLEELLQTYQTVIIDAPALMPVVDAAILAAKADGTVLVVSIDSTDSHDVRRSLAKLHSMGVGNVIGTVANRVKPQRSQVDEDYFFVAGTALRPALAPESDADRSLNA